MERRIGDSEIPGIQSIQEASQTLTLSSGRKVEVSIRTSPRTLKNRPRCILVHGNPGAMSDWSRVFYPLSDHADVLAIDLPGFGMSPLPDSGRTELKLQHLANDVIGAADAVGWSTPFHIAGHSHGGAVALTAAAAEPDRVAGVVGIGALGIRSPRSYRQLELPVSRLAYGVGGYIFRSKRLERLAKFLLRQALTTVYAPNSVSNAAIERQYSNLYNRPETLQRIIDLATTQPSDYLAKSVVPNVNCPVMLVHGDRDKLVPIKHAKGTHEAIMNAGGQGELVILEGAGHMIPISNAKRLLQVITPFITTA